MVVVTTDHGHDLGERGTFSKQYPHYDDHANIPLFVWHPHYPGNGGSLSDLTQTVDLFATILETAGASIPDNTHSRSLIPLVKSRSNGREALLYGTFGQGICFTNGEWTLFKSPECREPLYYYSPMIFKSLVINSISAPTGHGRYVPGVDLPQWQVPVNMEPLTQQNFLFHRSEDPAQRRNLWETKTSQRKWMLDAARDLMAREGAPPEQYERLGMCLG